MFSWIEVPRITACRVLVAEGSQDSLQKAIEKLRGYQKENEGVHNTYQVIVILSLLALAYHKQGEHDQALAVLARVPRTGAPRRLDLAVYRRGITDDRPAETVKTTRHSHRPG